ncbi:hypothetical protein IWQ61_004220 [Dispira simplex]|nr:hypothetical protein IWQ61_004220 [Dispira simplex]
MEYIEDKSSHKGSDGYLLSDSGTPSGYYPSTRRSRWRWILAGGLGFILLILCVVNVLVSLQNQFTLKKMNDLVVVDTEEHQVDSILRAEDSPSKHASDVFGHVYVVNLDKRTDRKDTMVNLLGFLDIPADFTKATTPDDLKFIPTSAVEKKVSTSRLACWRSHMNVYRQIVYNRLEHALILEDDADLEMEVVKLTQDKLQHLPKDWDLFYLGHCSGGIYIGPMYNQEHGIRILNGGWCTHGYMVSQKGARKLLGLLAQPTGAIDEMIANLGMKGRLETYAAHPLIVAQIRRKNDPSDIPGSNHDRQWEGLVHSARKTFWTTVLNETMPQD